MIRSLTPPQAAGNAHAFAVHMALYAEISNGSQLMENLEKRL
jgi:hypothetical protein